MISRRKHHEKSERLPQQIQSSELSPSRRKKHRSSTKQVALAAASVFFVGWFFVFVVVRLLTRDPCEVAKTTKAYLESSSRIGKQPLAPLPKIVHQQWKDDNIPVGLFTDDRERLKFLFPEPEYKHMLWTDKTGRQLIEDNFPWFLDVYDSYPMNIQRADAMRYFILYKHGGLYVDLDYEPNVNFWDALPRDRVGLIESPYKRNERVQNSVMSSPVGDPFWNVTFQVLRDRRFELNILTSTGPQVMDEAINRAPDQSWVHVLPCHNFHRVPFVYKVDSTKPFGYRVAKSLLYYGFQMKMCGSWERTDNCHYGVHHNTVSYAAQFKSDPKTWKANS